MPRCTIIEQQILRAARDRAYRGACQQPRQVARHGLAQRRIAHDRRLDALTFKVRLQPAPGGLDLG
jgi:hypothetical protein